MNSLSMDAHFTATVREVLEQHVASSHRVRRIGLGVTIASSALAIFGAAGATAAGLLLPGAPEIIPVGQTMHFEATGNNKPQLEEAPEGATAIQVDLWCDSAGSVHVVGAPTLVCAAGEEGTWMGFTAGLATSLSVESDIAWRLDARFVNSTTTPWGTNANGDTFGVINDFGEPDLIAVVAENGRDGFVYANDLADANCSNVATPEEALQCQQTQGTTDQLVPVYLSDGETVVGQFLVAGQAP